MGVFIAELARSDDYPPSRRVNRDSNPYILRFYILVAGEQQNFRELNEWELYSFFGLPSHTPHKNTTVKRASKRCSSVLDPG